jgi:2-amino-4-hydroxy-6-hydroxymethyldihydropteridine diphosphokinase
MFFDSRLAFDVTDSRLFAYVGLGSNLGDRAGYLLLAVRGMMDAGLMVTRLSSIYETEPVDVREQPAFLNMVAELRVQIFSPEQMLARLLRIEYALGRRRDTPRGPRTVDLDLLLYGDEQSATEFLQLPHPRLHERRFVLTPLAELAPELLHPTLQRSIRQLLARTDDEAEVKTWRATRETWGHGDAETRRKEKNG